jgi:hypothetical protein
MKPVVLLALALLSGSAVPPSAAEGIRFREVSRAWGIDFHHHHGGSGRRYILESTGSAPLTAG